jgi:hypothetical protein
MERLIFYSVAEYIKHIYSVILCFHLSLKWCDYVTIDFFDVKYHRAGFLGPTSISRGTRNNNVGLNF